MATTPEEFFVEGLVKPAPSSPSVFLDLPPTPDGNTDDPPSPGNILHLLWEDGIDDDLLYQCSDHHALLQAQQPFAQILSSPSSFVTNNDNRRGDTDTQGSKDPLQGGSGDLSSPFFKGADVVEAFLKGMEEATRFLPGENSIRSKAIKKRYSRDDYLEEEEEVRRTSKATMMKIADPEEVDIVSEMMLRGNEACVEEMEKLRIAMDTEEEEGRKNKTRGKGVSKAAGDVVTTDLPTLLLHCAEAVAANNRTVAGELLKQIKHNASATGDARQRLAQCFSKGLEARLLGTGNQLWSLVAAERPSVLELAKAYRLSMAACCFSKVAFIFSIKTIMDAAVGKSRVHVVDYGMNYGFHWAELICLMAKDRDGARAELKITAIGCSRRMFWSAKGIEEQGRRLRKCASEFGLPFEFRSITTTNWENVRIQDLNADIGEVLIVNDMYNFMTLMDESMLFDEPSPRDIVLSNIRNMRPDVFIQSIVNSSNGGSFLSRFREALFYYTALFDVFDATMPRQSESRLVLEQELLGNHLLNVVACEGRDLMGRPEKYRQCQARNQRAGLKQLPLKPGIVKGIKEFVKTHHKDFMLGEDGQWLLQGWMGRILFAHSIWVAAEGPVSQ